MKYYAVTNDPTELMHYGIKGMKWGVIRTDAQLGHPKKPRSAAYKKASSKLGKMMKSGIDKAKASWKEYNSPENKQIRADKRYMRRTDRYLQQARKGKLKYKKLDDWQVQRITDRLNAERVARSLSNAEKGKIKKILGAMGEGALRGIGKGVETRVSERIGRKGILKTDRLRKEQSNRMELEQQKAMARQKYNLDREEEIRKMVDDRIFGKARAQNKVNQEYYEEAARQGYNPHTIGFLAGQGKRVVLPNGQSAALPKVSIHRQTNKERADLLRGWKEQDRKDYLQKLQDESYAKQVGQSKAKSEYNDTKSKANTNNNSNPKSNIVSGSTQPRIAQSRARENERRHRQSQRQQKREERRRNRVNHR